MFATWDFVFIKIDLKLSSKNLFSAFINFNLTVKEFKTFTGFNLFIFPDILLPCFENILLTGISDNSSIVNMFLNPSQNIFNLHV